MLCRKNMFQLHCIRRVSWALLCDLSIFHFPGLSNSTAFGQQIKIVLTDPHFLPLCFNLSVSFLLVFPVRVTAWRCPQVLLQVKRGKSDHRAAQSSVHTPGDRQPSPKTTPFLGTFCPEFPWHTSTPVIGVYKMRLLYQWQCPVTRWQGSVLGPSAWHGAFCRQRGRMCRWLHQIWVTPDAASPNYL